MKSLVSYCLKVGVPFPSIRPAQGVEAKGAVAQADFKNWAIYTRGSVSELTMAHELAHLMADRDGERGDSHRHGPKFQNYLWEIEKHMRDEARREAKVNRG